MFSLLNMRSPNFGLKKADVGNVWKLQGCGNPQKSYTKASRQITIIPKPELGTFYGGFPD